MFKNKFSQTDIVLTDEELSLFKAIDTPEKIQTYISAIPHNFEKNGDSCMSVREVLSVNRAHCIEGALVAALALWIHGEPPIIMDMSANDRDDDHIITLYKRHGHWGAISKSNHAYLRFRDPVYRTLRELAMSYFHEYYNAKGEKTLRSYSRPLLLTRFKASDWITGVDAWKIAQATCDIKHYSLLLGTEMTHLRPIDEVQSRTMCVVEHHRF